MPISLQPIVTGMDGGPEAIMQNFNNVKNELDRMNSKIAAVDNDFTDIKRIVSSGDLNKLTSGKNQGSRTYIIDGVAVNNAPESFNGYGSLTVNDINSNTCTQILIASDGQRWTRGAGGQNKDFNEWRAF